MKKLFLFLGFFTLVFLIVSCQDAGIDAYDLDQDLDTETERNVPEEDLDLDEDENEDENEIDELKEEADEEEPMAELLEAFIVSETEIVFMFSTPVNLLSLSLSFDQTLEPDIIEEGNLITVILDEDLTPGLRFTVELEVEDEWYNSISEEVELISLNRHLPELLINELRTENNNSTNRSEFVEFKILSDGNMGGLQVFICRNNRLNMVYEFEPDEVEEDEYLVLYLRAQDDLSNTLPGRNFWVMSTIKLLGKTSAVYVTDQDGQVLAAVMIAENPSASWPNAQLAATAEFLFEQDAWKSPAGNIGTPMDAVNSARINTSTTRSISRDETELNTKTSADWYITADNRATPGMPNSSQRLN